MSDSPYAEAGGSALFRLIARLEPWLFVIAILGILFAPPKGWFWFLLLVAAILRTARLWNEKWTAYRADTAQSFLSAFVTVPVVLLLYFGLGRIWPGLVHSDPEAQQIERFELGSYFLLEPEGSVAFPASMRVARDPRAARSWRVTATRSDESGMTLGQLSGYVTERSLTESRRGEWSVPVRIRDLRGSFLPGPPGVGMGPEFRAELSFAAGDGRARPRPTRLRILREGRVLYSARVLPPS